MRHLQGLVEVGNTVVVVEHDIGGTSRSIHGSGFRASSSCVDAMPWAR